MPTERQIAHESRKTYRDMYSLYHYFRKLNAYYIETNRPHLAISDSKISQIGRKIRFERKWEDAPAIIEGYHSNYSLRNHLKGKSKNLYGFELEIELTEDSISDDHAKQIHELAKYTIGEGLIRTERDGSLNNGVEIICAPLAETELRMMYSKLYRFLRGLSSLGFTSHNNNRCGLHIHISKPDDTVVEKIERIILGSDIQKSFWKEFSRRKELRYCQLLRQRSDASSKYFAINKLKDSTLELRFFRGTLNPTTFLACLETVFAIVSYTDKEADRKRTTWRSFCKHARTSGKYTQLVKYVNAKMKGDWRTPKYGPRDPVKQAEKEKIKLDALEKRRLYKQQCRFRKQQNEIKQYIGYYQNWIQYHSPRLGLNSADNSTIADIKIKGKLTAEDKKILSMVTPLCFVRHNSQNKLSLVVYRNETRGRRSRRFSRPELSFPHLVETEI